MPNESKDYFEDHTRGDTRRLTCATCNRTTNHRVMGSRNIVVTVEDGSFWKKVWDDYEIVACQGCDEVSFRHAHRDSEDELTDPETGASEGLVETALVYPHRVARQRIVPANAALPLMLRRAYPEAVIAYEHGMPLLCAMGIRLCLEAFCSEQSVPGKTLYDKIEALALGGEITATEAPFLHHIRDVGNAAAHEVCAPERLQIDRAMTVIEGLLYRHYVVPQAFDEPLF